MPQIEANSQEEVSRRNGEESESSVSTAGLSVRVRTGIHTFSPAVGRLEPIRDRLRSFQSEPHPAPLRAKSETQKFTKLPPMINLIAPLSLFARSGFVSPSMSLFTPTNQIDSSCNIRREFDFFRRLFFRAPAARGSMAHIEKYIENQNFQANSRKKV